MIVGSSRSTSRNARPVELAVDTAVSTNARAMTVALNRPDQLALHLRGALRNGVTVAELREVLLQTVVYCGIPAAHTAFKVAQEVLGSDTD